MQAEMESGRFAVVPRDNAAEALLPLDITFVCWREIRTKDFVANIRPLQVRTGFVKKSMAARVSICERINLDHVLSGFFSALSGTGLRPFRFMLHPQNLWVDSGSGRQPIV